MVVVCGCLRQRGIVTHLTADRVDVLSHLLYRLANGFTRSRGIFPDMEEVCDGRTTGPRKTQQADSGDGCPLSGELRQTF